MFGQTRSSLVKVPPLTNRIRLSLFHRGNYASCFYKTDSMGNSEAVERNERHFAGQGREGLWYTKGFHRSVDDGPHRDPDRWDDFINGHWWQDSEGHWISKLHWAMEGKALVLGLRTDVGMCTKEMKDCPRGIEKSSKCTIIQAFKARTHTGEARM